MRKLLLLLLAGLLATAAPAQPTSPGAPAFTWATASGVINRLPGTNGSVAGYALGTVAATGESWLSFPDSVATLYGGWGMGRQRLERYRSDGSLAFRRYLGGTSTLTQLRAAPNGRLYLLGFFLNSVTLDATHTLTIAGSNLPHDFIACLDASGTVLYARDLTLGSNAAYSEAQTLVPGAADQVYVALARSTGGNLLVHRLDAQGNTVSTLTHSGGMYVSGLDVDPQGTLFVTGTCVRAAGSSFNGTPVVPGVSGNGYNQFVACYEPTGTLRWVKFMGDFTCPNPQVRSDRAGGVYWLTELVGPATLGGISLPGPANGGTQDFLLARLDAAGTVRWARDVPTTQLNDAGMGQLNSIDTDAAGNAYVVGQTHGSVQWAPTVLTTAGNATAQSLLVLRVSPQGVVEWARTAASAEARVYGGTLAVGPAGEVLVTGIGTGAMSFDGLVLPPVSRSHHFAARLTPAATPTGTARLADAGWQLAPNPSSGRVELRLPPGTALASVALFDALGRQLASTTAATPAFDLSAYPPGLYLVRARSAAGTWAGRVVKQ